MTSSARGSSKAPSDSAGRWVFASSHDARIDLDLHYADLGVAQHLAQAAAVAAADDQDVEAVLRTAAQGGFPRQDRRMGEHLVVDIFIRLGGLDRAVQGEHPAEQPVLENREFLAPGMLPVQEPVDGQGLADAVMQRFVEPVHRRPSQPAPPRRCSEISTRPGTRASRNTSTAR